MNGQRGFLSASFPPGFRSSHIAYSSKIRDRDRFPYTSSSSSHSSADMRIECVGVCTPLSRSFRRTARTLRPCPCTPQLSIRPLTCGVSMHGAVAVSMHNTVPCPCTATEYLSSTHHRQLAGQTVMGDSENGRKPL